MYAEGSVRRCQAGLACADTFLSLHTMRTIDVRIGFSQLDCMSLILCAASFPCRISQISSYFM
jgi:hypothetical protein